MSKNDNEILKRVLLLMNYDNKRTLSENVNIINEQSEQQKRLLFSKFPCIKSNLDKGIGQVTALDDGSAVYFLNGNWYYNNGRKRVNGVSQKYNCNDVVFSPKKLSTTNLAEFLKSLDNPNQSEIVEFETKGYKSVLGKMITSWVDLLMKKNINELLDQYNQLVKMGKGGNTQGLPNFGKGKTTLSSIILENEIYNRKSQNGDVNAKKPENIKNKEKGYIPKEYFTKSASQIYNETYESLPNEGDGDDFRLWFNQNYPEIAKSPCGDGEKLDLKGGYNTKYIICAAEYKPKGSNKTAYQLFKETKKENKLVSQTTLDSKYKTDVQNLGVINKNCEPLCFLNNDELLVMKSCLGNTDSTKWKTLKQNWDFYSKTDKESLLDYISYELNSCVKSKKISKPDFDFLNKKIENFLYGRMKSSSQQNLDVKQSYAKSKGKENEVKKNQEEFYKFIITQQRVTNIYNKEWLECSIGASKPEKCGNIPYCGRSAKEFFEKIARGELKTKDGNIVGDPYTDKNGNVKYFEPDVFDGSDLESKWDIPCSSDFWDEWGGTIQISAAAIGAIAGIVLPVLGYASYALLAELSIDAVAGATALYQSIKEKDKTGIAINTVFLSLPFLLDIPASDKFFKNLKYGKENLQNLSDKFEQFKLSKPNYTSEELAEWIKNLSGYEIAMFKNVISKADDAADSYSRDKLKEAIKKEVDLFKNAKQGARAWIPNTTIGKLLIYMGPMVGYHFAIKNKVIKDTLLRHEKNKELTVRQVVAWDAALSNTTTDNLIKIQREIEKNNNFLIEKTKTESFKRIENIKKELENTDTSEETANQLLSEFQSATDNLISEIVK
jgi:hypothetical protein